MGTVIKILFNKGSFQWICWSIIVHSSSGSSTKLSQSYSCKTTVEETWHSLEYLSIKVQPFNQLIIFELFIICTFSWAAYFVELQVFFHSLYSHNIWSNLSTVDHSSPITKWKHNRKKWNTTAKQKTTNFLQIQQPKEKTQQKEKNTKTNKWNTSTKRKTQPQENITT